MCNLANSLIKHISGFNPHPDEAGYAHSYYYSMEGFRVEGHTLVH